MRMRHLVAMSFLLAVPAMAQDTSVIIRGTSKPGTAEAETTMVIRRRGQNDQVVRVTPQLSRELRATLDRQVDESRRAMSNLREIARAAPRDAAGILALSGGAAKPFANRRAQLVCATPKPGASSASIRANA